MHGARQTGWSGEIPSSPEPTPHAHGRHERPAPPFAAVVPPGELPPTTGRAEHDPLADTNPTGGLSKFDLGMVPASVTPPPTWRRAAWFAVASSAATLGGLMFATAALVGNSTTFQVIDLPNMPRGGEYPPLPTDPYVQTTRPEPAPGPPREDPSRESPAPGRTGGLLPLPGRGDGPVGGVRRPGFAPPTPGGNPAPAPGGDKGEGGSGGDSGRPGDGGTRPPTTPPPPQPPPTTTPPPSSEAPAISELALFPDTEAMRQRTASYFAAISGGDLRSAYEMTTGPLREEGFTAFASRYAGVASIQVVDSSVELDSTITTLRIVREDGTRLTQRRRLDFTPGDKPRVEADELVS